jgi:hypothetical protein
VYPNSTLPDCLQRSSAHGRRERQRCPLPRVGRTSFALAHPWKMLAPDMVSIPRIRAEVHRPAIRAPTCVCASSCFWTDRLTVSVPIKRKSTAWPPPDTVHLRNQNPLTVRRYPGAVCHPGYFGRKIYIALSRSTLCGGGDAHMLACSDLRKHNVLPVSPCEPGCVRKDLLGFAAQNRHNPGVPSEVRVCGRISNA